nr:PREDICTED: uncharacterized protein LOC106703849 [Latimeria chalumnae]|eukprot:XP_014344985.1 PREDICTED: uncharacterized protein LOC106703849 [Latimeria chalumnae]
MRDLFTNRNQKCWKEIIDKEMYTRVAWKLKHGHELSKHLSVSRKTETDKCSAVKSVLPVIKFPPPAAVKKKEVLQDVPIKSEELLVEMRPVTPQTLGLLYKGFSREGKGRFLYLKQRKMKSPEEKFDYPLLSSWEYGWKLGDFVKEIRTPMHGRSRIVKDTFYKRNGVFNIPSETDSLALIP